MRFLEHGPDTGPAGGGIDWLPECDWCLKREAKRSAEAARREELQRPRVCAAPGCAVTFTPAALRQVECGVACRLRAWRAERARLPAVY
jgi:hypothetical protein